MSGTRKRLPKGHQKPWGAEGEGSGRRPECARASRQTLPLPWASTWTQTAGSLKNGTVSPMISDSNKGNNERTLVEINLGLSNPGRI